MKPKSKKEDSIRFDINNVYKGQYRYLNSSPDIIFIINDIVTSKDHEDTDKVYFKCTQASDSNIVNSQSWNSRTYIIKQTTPTGEFLDQKEIEKNKITENLFVGQRRKWKHGTLNEFKIESISQEYHSMGKSEEKIFYKYDGEDNLCWDFKTNLLNKSVLVEEVKTKLEPIAKEFDRGRINITQERIKNKLIDENDIVRLDRNNKILEQSIQKEMINHPSHYQSGKFEVIDVIEEFGLGFNLGNSIKYILRAGKKFEDKTLEDLRKAKWYLEREIENRSK